MTRNGFFFLTLLAALGVAGPASAQGVAPGNDDLVHVGAPPAERFHKLEQESLTIYNSRGEHHEFTVEMALHPEDQERGLMFRTHVEPGTGMLFAYATEDERSFWMKNTLVPLDMIFISYDGMIRHIHANAQPNDLTPISSEGPARAILELPGGTAEELGIKSGDRVSDEKFFGSLESMRRKRE